MQKLEHRESVEEFYDTRLAEKMNCKSCNKILGGGFKQDNGGFKCADCVIIDVDIESAIFSNDLVFKKSLEALDKKVTGRKYKELVCDIKEILINIRHISYMTTEKLHKLKHNLNKPIEAVNDTRRA